jgi:hypothetical protein
VKISGSIEGLDIVVSGLDDASLEVREATFQGVLLALNAAFRACDAMLSATDHSLRQLAEMGHPYGFTRPQLIHDPDVLVHMQSGDYRAALRRKSPSGSFGDIVEGEVWNDSPLDAIIQGGTSRMRARPWMKYVIDHFGEDFADIIEARIMKAIQAA